MPPRKRDTSADDLKAAMLAVKATFDGAVATSAIVKKCEGSVPVSMYRQSTPCMNEVAPGGSLCEGPCVPGLEFKMDGGKK